MAVVQGNTLEVYNFSPLKILWDFSVVCLNLPIRYFSLLHFQFKMIKRKYYSRMNLINRTICSLIF